MIQLNMEMAGIENVVISQINNVPCIKIKQIVTQEIDMGIS
jgi:hypothetical protein